MTSPPSTPIPMPSFEPLPVDDLMLQAACDAYAKYNESVGEPGEYFPDAMKAALEAAMKAEGMRRWAIHMAQLERESGADISAGAPNGLRPLQAEDFS